MLKRNEGGHPRFLLWSRCQASVTACSGTLLPEREPQTFSEISEESSCVYHQHETAT